MASQTLYDKLWNAHEVTKRDDGSSLIYIDRHLLHEVTSPQAFEGLQLANRAPWRLSANIASPDHNVPTVSKERLEGVSGIKDKVSRLQVVTLDDNCDKFDIAEFTINDARQGILHVVVQKKSKNMQIRVTGELGAGVTSKDVVLAIIAKIGTAGGTGYAIEFAGQVFEQMSMEGRMTVCNMAIEAGARVGMVAVDDITIDYVKGRPYAPTDEQWQQAEQYWRTLYSDADAVFDSVVEIDGSEIAPQVSWGTSPEMVVDITQSVPTPDQASDEAQEEGWLRAYTYMGLEAGQKITDIQLDRIFIGSCTNSRIEDLRDAAAVIKGRKVADNIKEAIVVAGSGQVKLQAEAEGLDTLFTEAGFEWREPGCSMCLAMNADKLEPQEHCASTSNRNFEGRQGNGGRTHLVSPAMAAAAALAGHFVDVRTF